MANRLGGGVRQYVVLYRKPNSSLPDGQIVSSNTTFLQITGLEVYTEYSIRAVAISGEGVPFRGADVLAMTDEGGKQLLSIESVYFFSVLLIQLFSFL